jgi:hypothetical protein
VDHGINVRYSYRLEEIGRAYDVRGNRVHRRIEAGKHVTLRSQMEDHIRLRRFQMAHQTSQIKQIRFKQPYFFNAVNQIVAGTSPATEPINGMAFIQIQDVFGKMAAHKTGYPGYEHSLSIIHKESFGGG